MESNYKKIKKYGQFFTSPLISNFMIKLLNISSGSRILDAGIGKGVFVDEILKLNKNVKIDGIDIDDGMIEFCKKKYNENENVNLFNCDYLNTHFDEKYDYIVSNPPYNKFQAIKNRYEYIKQFKLDYGVEMSGYSNQCVYFLIKSLNELKRNGKCCYIIPYEFLNTGYGTIIKQYIKDTHFLDSIFIFDNNISLFDEAITTSCIMFFDKSNKNEAFNVYKINSITDNNFDIFEKKKLSFDNIQASEKWTNVFFNKTIVDNKLVKLNRFCKVKRGIATGNNKYFVLNKTRIHQLGLSKAVCFKCVTKSPDIINPIFDLNDFNKLYEDDKGVFLFNGENSKCDNDYNYIKFGEDNRVNDAYLLKIKTPWYKLESKDIAPIWISVFARNKIKVIRNLCNINNLTTFHSVFLNDNYQKYTNILFCYLLSTVSQKILFLNKREYGDGLSKFEPNDFNNALCINFDSIVEEDLHRINNIYDEMCIKYNDNMIGLLNNIFMKYCDVKV